MDLQDYGYFNEYDVDDYYDPEREALEMEDFNRHAEQVDENKHAEQDVEDKYAEQDDVVLEQDEQEDVVLVSRESRSMSRSLTPGTSKSADDEYKPSSGNTSENTDDEYQPDNGHHSENTDDEYQPNTYDNDFKSIGLADDNRSKSYRKRINRIIIDESDEEYTITRNIKSDDFGDSQTPWKVVTKIWNRLPLFQQEGVQWLQKKTDHRSGGILADEMGLGKTVQTVVYLRSIAETGRTHYKSTGLDTALIVCHVSILTQWIQTLHEWFPKVRVFLLHSNGTTGRDDNYADKVFRKLQDKKRYFPHGAIVLTTYNGFTKHHEKFVKHLWQVVILDEGHYIRNEKTKCSAAMRKLMTPQRFLLTGTPFQNRLAEFWKLIDFVHPGKLSDSTTFHRHFTNIINAGANLGCSPESAAKAYECLVALHIAVKPLILRRLQEDHKDVLNLPAKNEIVLSCELSDRQRRLYLEYLESEQVKEILAQNLKPFIGYNRIGEICNHPGLFCDAKLGSEKFGEIEDSGKLAMTFKLFDEWFKNPKNRVIFFTQRVKVIDMMMYFLETKGIRCVSFTGADSAAARPKIIKNFEEDQNIKVFLMTTRAGGLGLNLTCANKVIIFDPDWNPQADNQAKNRIYRMGQENDVTIIRLISNGTLEDRKFLKQTEKESLAKRLLHNTDEEHFVPSHTLQDHFRLAPKGLDGSEIGVYLPGEIAPDATKKKSKDKEERKESKKQLKNKLAGFEDRKLLISLFDDEKLVAMREHSISVQNSIHMNRKQRLDLRQAVDKAVGSLIHTEGRLAHTWKQEFHKLIREKCTKKPVVSDYFVEKEQIDSYWTNVHSQFKVRDDQRELNRLLVLAKNILIFLNGVTGATEEKIFAIFVRDHDRTNPTQMYFIHEILSTLGRFDEEKKEWRIRSKYRDVVIKDPQDLKRKSEIRSPLYSKKAKQAPSSDIPLTSTSSETPSTSQL